MLTQKYATFQSSYSTALLQARKPENQIIKDTKAKAYSNTALRELPRRIEPLRTDVPNPMLTDPDAQHPSGEQRYSFDRQGRSLLFFEQGSSLAILVGLWWFAHVIQELDVVN